MDSFGKLPNVLGRLPKEIRNEIYEFAHGDRNYWKQRNSYGAIMALKRYHWIRCSRVKQNHSIRIVSSNGQFSVEVFCGDISRFTFLAYATRKDANLAFESESRRFNRNPKKFLFELMTWLMKHN